MCVIPFFIELKEDGSLGIYVLLYDYVIILFLYLRLTSGHSAAQLWKWQQGNLLS